MKSFNECKYSAFISYAHADDEATELPLVRGLRRRLETEA